MRCASASIIRGGGVVVVVVGGGVVRLQSNGDVAGWMDGWVRVCVVAVGQYVSYVCMYVLGECVSISVGAEG